MLRATMPWVMALLCLCLTLPLTAQSTSTGGGRDGGESENATECIGTCSANAGGAISICTEETLILNGALPGVSDPMPQWVASPDNPTSTFIESPNELQTVVTADDGGMLMPGEYEFTLTVTCSDGSTSCDDVVVTVAEIGTVTIEEHEAVTCAQSFTFVGSAPNPGVATSWSVNTLENVTPTMSSDGLSYTLTNGAGDAPCIYTVTYQQSIGTCVIEVTTTIEFIQSYESVNPSVNNRNCSLGAVLIGVDPGCGGTASWAYVGGASTATDVTISNSNNWITGIEGAVVGPHTFSYTIENGECPSATEFVTVELRDSCSIPCLELGPNTSIRTCRLLEELQTYTLSVPNPGSDIELEWEILSVPAGITVEFDGPNNGNSVTLTFSGTTQNPEILNFVSIRLTGKSLTVPDCEDSKRFTFRSWKPSIAPVDSEVFLNCGGDMAYLIAGNLNYNGELQQFIIDEAPADFSAEPVNMWKTLQEFTTLDLRVPGTYRLRATNRTHSFAIDQEACVATASFTIIVNDVPTINAGADQILCATSAQLNGSEPLNNNSEPVDIPVFWEQISGPPVTFSATDVTAPVITGLQYGEVYEFQYSLPGDPDCIRQDITSVTINPEGVYCYT